MVKRGIWPFKGGFAISGGFVRHVESLDQAAVRELLEETGVNDVYWNNCILVAIPAATHFDA